MDYQFSCLFLRVLGIALGVALMLSIYSTVDNGQKWQQAVESMSTSYYIDGVPAQDNFNARAIDLSKYKVRFDGDNVYLNTMEEKNNSRLVIFPFMFKI